MDHSQINKFNSSGCLLVSLCNGTPEEPLVISPSENMARVNYTNITGNPLNFTTNITGNFRMVYLAMSLGAAMSETVSITLVSPVLPQYNTLLFEYDLSDEQYLYINDCCWDFMLGDQLNIQCPFAGLSYLTMIVAAR